MSINERIFHQARLAEDILRLLPAPARQESDLMAFGLVIAPLQIEILRGMCEDALAYEKRSNNYDAHWGRKAPDGQQADGA